MYHNLTTLKGTKIFYFILEYVYVSYCFMHGCWNKKYTLIEHGAYKTY